jgi:hypothetical protein
MKPHIKGANFEREVAKIFSVRFRDYLGVEQGFLRNTTSGSVFGGKNSHRLDKVVEGRKDSGDILTPPGFRFSIECKHYKTPPSFGSIWKSVGEWEGWLRQASLCGRKAYMLIVKYNNVQELAFFGVNKPDEFYPYPMLIFSCEDVGIVQCMPLSEVLKFPDEWFFGEGKDGG